MQSGRGRGGDGRGKGRGKRQLANLKSLMETLGFTAEQAMDALEVPEDERRRYADML